MKRDINLFIQDILDSLKDIDSFSKGLNEASFKEDKLRQNAIIRSLEVIGEAVKNIPIAFREKHSQIPWRKIAGFRDVIIHAYFGMNLERIWSIIKDDLPILKKQIKEIKIDLDKL